VYSDADVLSVGGQEGGYFTMGGDF
jgi:hypothetical protein